MDPVAKRLSLLERKEVYRWGVPEILDGYT